MIKYFLPLILLFSSFICSSQDLPRMGSLGGQLQTATENEGIDVITVIENTTASTIGLQAGDLITQVNGQSYIEVQSFVAAIGDW